RRPVVRLLTETQGEPRNLFVVPSGPLPLNSAELLGRPVMNQVLADLRPYADVVILDAPPLVPVADTQALLDHVTFHACVIVARERQTTWTQARRARAILEARGLHRVGLVVTGVGSDAIAAAQYGYYSPVPPDESSNIKRISGDPAPL